MDQILIVAVGAYLLSLLTRGVPSYNEIVVNDVRFKVTDISLAGYSGIVYIDIMNYSRTSIPLDRGNGNLFYGSDSVGNFILRNPVKLEPGKVTTVEVIGSIPSIGFGIAVIQAIKTGQYLKDLVFKGELIYGFAKIPINRVIYKA